MRGQLGTAPQMGRMVGAPRLALAMLLAIAFVMAASTAHAAKPTQPTIREAYPVGTEQVLVQWLGSVDASGHPLTYEVYRSKVPITSSMITPVMSPLVSLVTPVSLTPVDTTWTAIVNANVAGGEVADVYTWYYAIRACDSLGIYSALSGTTAPNLHGYRMSSNVYSCQRCHSVHGSPTPPGVRDTSSWICYYCHGRTDGGTTGGGDRSTLNTKADFYDYANLPEGGSQHRSAKMTSGNQQCRGCHTPHRASYYFSSSDGVSVVYDPIQSFRMMLRVQTGVDSLLKPTYTNGYYSRNDVTVENTSFCFSCHGSATASPDDGSAETNMGYVSDGGYARTGGDHNESGYASAVHGSGVIYSNDYVPSDPSADDPKPQVQCLACHDNHASAADKLIAYRGVDTASTPSGTYAQAELCYACHSAATSESRVAAGYSAPFAWNGRDVKAQFGKASRHPTTARVTDPVPEAGSWSQTTEADFASNRRTHVTATSGGSGTSGIARLEQSYTTGVTAFHEGFEDLTWTTDFPTSTGEWARSTTFRPVGSYDIRATGGGTNPDTLASRVVDLAGWTNVSVSFRWRRSGLDAGEFMRVQYRTDGGTWVDGWVTEGNGNDVTDGGTPGSFTIASPSATTEIRLTMSASSTSEYGYWDEIIIRGDQPNGYWNQGTMVSTLLPTFAGSLSQWGTVTYSATGSGIVIDVLDQNETVLLENVASGTSLAELSETSLRLRARMTGDAPIPPSVSDSFDDASFNTGVWSDYFLNGSLDPDSALTTNFTTLSFATALIDATTGMDSRSPNDNATGWYRSTINGSDGTAGYARTGTTDYDLDRIMLKSYGDLSSYSSASVSFQWRNGNSTMTSGDYLYVEWSADGGGTWGTVASVTATTADGTWGELSASSLPVGSDCVLRVRAKVQDAANDSWWIDTIAASASKGATNDWPKETGGVLRLRAEGPAFDATNGVDEGEIVYVKPSAAPWISEGDFDMTVRVAQTPNAGNGYRAGLMLRAGSTEANAQATSAAMAGVYVTNTNIIFEYRTTAGAGQAALAGGNTTGAAPVWLRLERRGTAITAKASSDGQSWTTLGSGTVTIGSSDTVLAGVALTSGTNDQFAEAEWDDFTIVGGQQPSSTTPVLEEWTVNYTYVPAPATGSLTCASCHNVHMVERGAVDTAWQLARASVPGNTKTTYTGTPTQFCLECHDGATPSRTATADTLVPYTVQLSDKSTAPFFLGWDKTTSGADWASSGHAATTIPTLAGQFGCETCHDPHASDNQRLTALTQVDDGRQRSAGHLNATRDNSTTWAEQNLCFACHDGRRSGSCGGCHGSTLGTLNAATPFAGTYRHPIATTGEHSDTETGADLGPAGNRHAECADCHDPHAARPGVHVVGTSNPGEALRGAVGIKPLYGPAFSGESGQSWETMNRADSFVSERMTGESGDFEAYVCLKCHSSYSGQPFTLTAAQGNGRSYISTDLALEFNPSNQSEHNVFGQQIGMEGSFTVNGQTYSMPLPPDSAFLRTGWTSNSKVTCTDCHSNTAAGSARGPHGSSTPWLMATGYKTWTTATNLNNLNTADANGLLVICAKCHVNLSTANAAHADHGNRAACVACHIRIPHGWKRPRLLGYSGDPSPYRTQGTGAVNGIALRNRSGPNDWQDGSVDCGGGCDNRHNYSGVVWP